MIYKMFTYDKPHCNPNGNQITFVKKYKLKKRH